MPYDPNYHVTLTIDADGFSGAYVANALDEVGAFLAALDIRVVDVAVDEPQWRATDDPMLPIR